MTTNAVPLLRGLDLVNMRSGLRKRHVVFLVAAVLCVCGAGLQRRRLSHAPAEIERDHGRRLLHAEGAGSRVDSLAAAFATQAQHEQETAMLPQCYSNADASPSKGSWRKVADGVEAAPSDLEHWAYPERYFSFLTRCQDVWNTKHAGEGPRPYWEWEPDDCHLERVTAEKFCEVMQGRKGIMFVGDSLTRLATTTLASILRARIVIAQSIGDVWRACDEGLTVKFVRNDYLDPRTTSFRAMQCFDEDGNVANNTHCVVFANDVHLKYFDTLVVNTGAHPRRLEQYGRAVQASGEALAAAMRRLHGDRAIMIVRNTVPGHSRCTDSMFEGPVDEPRAKEMVSAAPAQYAWSEFAAFNEQLEAAFSPQDGWMLLDAYSPTFLRADSHIGGGDCLHYCIPGPADHWIRLLYNMLLSATGEIGET